jgi:hypothetical protein
VKAENKAEAALKLIRTAAISGRVFDEDGDPVTGANVQIVPMNQKKGNGPISSANTNDRGEYRVFNVKPGKYRIAVSYTPSDERLRVKIQASRSPRETGSADTYATTFYPAGLAPKLGQIVNIEAGADLGGFDVQILRTCAVTVKGTVAVMSGSAPAFVLINLFPVRQAAGSQSHDEVIQDGSGAFELRHVLPGSYIVEATTPIAGQNLSGNRFVEVGNTNKAFNLRSLHRRPSLASLSRPKAKKCLPG